LLDSSVMGTLSIKLVKSSRNPECRGENRRERVREALFPHRSSYLYGRQKFQRFRRSLYRALLTKNRKLLGWLPRPFTRTTVHDVHPCFHVPHSPPVSFTTDSTYQRPLATVHERRIPNSCRIPSRCARRPRSSIRDVRTIAGRVDVQEKKKG